jgi:hypothetical protein
MWMCVRASAFVHCECTDERRAESARSIENLKDEITRLAGHLNATNHRFLMLIAEFDRREGWSDAERSRARTG